MARELVREVRVLDRNLVENGRRLEAALRVQGSALTRIPGVGVILAAKIAAERSSLPLARALRQLHGDGAA